MNGWQLLCIWAAFLGGVVLESVFDLTLLALYVLGGVALVMAVCWRHSSSVTVLMGSLCCVALSVGIIRTQLFEQQFDFSVLSQQVGQTIEIAGRIVQEPDRRTNFTQLYVENETDRVLVRADRLVDVQYGDNVLVQGVLEVPTAFETDTGRMFDYPSYLQVRGVQYVLSFAEVSVTDPAGPSLRGLLYEIKNLFVGKLEQVIAHPQVNLGVGLLLGVQQALGDDLEQAFRQTGIIHIVVLSGYNVMLVVGFFWWFASWFLPYNGRIVFGLVGIALFALMVGLSATVVRASVMASILLVGKLMGRTYDVLRALLFAAAVMVLINPYILLYDIGFQLSFMATLGLVVVLPQFESTLMTQSRTLKLRDLFIATVVTQVFVLPLLMYYIGEVSVVSVIVNMLVLPMVPVAMLMTFAAGVVGMVWLLAGSVIGVLAYLPLQYILLIAQWFGGLSFAAIVIPPVSVPVVLGMYVILAVLCWVCLKRHSDVSEPGNTQSLVGWEVVEEKQIGVDVSKETSTPIEPPVFFR